ncbi:MAG: hypothetical protein ACM30G_05675 [Micromonosporaceae bacterium]
MLMLVAAIALGVIVAAMVYAGSSRRARRYRPGRPFSFTPVWFLSAPEQQLPSSRRRELVAAPAEPGVGRDETGGASDRW